MFYTKKKFILSAIAVAIIAVVAVFAFYNNANLKKLTDIKIGVILPLSGNLANVGEDVAKGIKLYSETHPNAKFIIENDEGDSKKSISAMRRLISIDGARYFFGPLGPVASEAVYASQSDSEKETLTLVALSMCADQFKNYNNMICNYPSPYFQIKESYRYPVTLGKKTFYAVLANDAFGADLLRMIAKVSDELGLKMLDSSKVNANDLEFRTVTSKIIKANPEFVMVATSNQSTNIRIIKELKEIKYGGIILSGGDFEEKMIKENQSILEGVYLAGQAKLDYGSEFIKLYSKKYGGNPNLYTAFGYAWGDILYELIKTDSKKQFKIDEVMDSVNLRSDELAIKGMKFDKEKKEIKFPMQVFRVEKGDLKSVFVSSGK